MIQYATLPHRDYGAVSTFDQQQGTGVDRGDGIVADGGEPASRVEQQRQNCALAGCLEPPTKTLHIKRGDVDWYDRYCDEHAKLQLETENAEVCR